MAYLGGEKTGGLTRVGGAGVVDDALGSARIW
jgi:hypothetical protein